MSDAGGRAEDPTAVVPPRSGRDREATPDFKSRSSDHHDLRRSRSSRHHEDDGEDEDEEEARRRRRRQREEETPEERHERRKRRREQETEEERAERHRRRAERDARREAEEAGAGAGTDGGRDDVSVSRSAARRRRSRSIESYRSHRSYRSREYDDDRRRRDYDERRYYDDRRRDDVYYSDRRGSPPPRRRNEDDYYYSPRRASPPRRRRDSPMYDSPRRQRSSPPPPPPPRSHREQSSAAEAAPDRAEGTPKRDEADALLESVDSEARSVFVSQLAAALTSRDLGMFFEDKLGKGSVRDARVVTDRVTKRSKGIAYVELASVPLVHRAIGLTGTLVMGLPIMITFTESERNNAHVNLDSLLAGSTVIRPATGASGIPLPGVTAALPPPSVRDANPDAPIPYYRLYVGNLYYALTAEDLRQVFEPFGELSYVDLPMEPQTNRSRGYAFVQYKELAPAQMALQSMNGFELAGRSLKVATVHPKGAGSAPAAVNSAPAPAPAYMPQQESSYRVDLDDREGTRLDNKARQELMFKLARQADPTAPKAVYTAPRLNLPTQQTVFVHGTNMFNPAEETESNWHLDLQEDIQEEVEAKYGKLVQIFVDKQSSDGNVYMKFVDVEGAAKAVAGLNGRYFAGRRISANFTSEVLYKAAVPS